jgi:hypothetical protein
VEALVEKTDVKAQAKQAVADAKSTVADKTADARQAMTDKTADIKHAVTEKTTDAKQAVTEKTTDVKQSVTDKKDEATVTAQASTPDGVADAGRRARAVAGANRPALVAAATFALGLLIGSRRRR